MSSSPYTPKYGSPDRIPLSGPGSPNTPDEISDEFTQTEKLRALSVAESRLESDINEGYEISDPEMVHQSAVEAYSSYILVFGAKAPQSIRAGSHADAGDARQAYADNFKEMYDELVSSIKNASGDESGGGGGTDGGDGGTGGYDAGTVDFEVF